jgi:hypothetical protein
MPGRLVARHFSLFFLPQRCLGVVRLYRKEICFVKLWDFRGRVGRDDANSVIVAAHIKPRVEPDGPDEPMAAYFHSLKNTAAFLGVDFDDWDALAQKHH